MAEFWSFAKDSSHLSDTKQEFHDSIGSNKAAFSNSLKNSPLLVASLSFGAFKLLTEEESWCIIAENGCCVMVSNQDNSFPNLKDIRTIYIDSNGF